MNLYQSITKVTNFYLEDIQKTIENGKKQLDSIINRIKENEEIINQKKHNPKEIQQLLYINHRLLAENCFFIEEQNSLLKQYQSALNILRHKYLLNYSPAPTSNISECVHHAFEEMLLFYKEKDLKENVKIIENFLRRDNSVFAL